MPASSIMEHIQELVREEQEPIGKEDETVEERGRLEEIEAELDQCWDLLRQRRAKVEFGGAPDTAEPRDPEQVRDYLQ